MMEALFASGRIAEFILVMMLAEATVFCVLAYLWRDRLWHGRLPLAGLLLNLAAGACLVLALRAVLVDAPWTLAGFWLALALAAHLGDLFRRLWR